ncbi:hypothetical protein [Altererythrobacter lutimaris]|uniref:Uncharacterized protein n=1 Tax=Altererythrobacter lutimaris TaxID=2743979 RepID=A0A850H8H6_9SPHN|nr:hypothetical protein [Altererythrobacter lutimaris]NVE93525.1 hypothetical protein [Altererythrobacter lutimaris]
MEPKYGTRRKTGSTTAIVGTALGSFVLGAAIVGYFLWDSSETEPVETEVATIEQAAIEDVAAVETETPEPSPTATASEAAEAAEAVERVAEQQGGIDQRLAAAEQRLARLDLQAQAAAGNAARAEGLLIAFAARRALERGEELGFLADQLRLRFGDNWPNAVRTVISFSRDPITLDRLLFRLEGLGPEISEAESISSWADIQRELGQLFIIRREDTPSPQPERRLERARLFLESGRTDAAIAEVEAMPGAEQAATWIADAKRFRDAMDALDRLETAAVLEPRRLRDGAGNRVEQPSPVEAVGDS